VSERDAATLRRARRERSLRLMETPRAAPARAVLLIGLALVALAASGCRASQRDEPPTGPLPVEEPAPPATWTAPPGAVLTVTSAVSREAPAGLLDRAAAVRLRLSGGAAGAPTELLLPLPATASWVLPGARGAADLEVTLVTARGEVLAQNRFRTGPLDGMVGSLRLEVGPRGEVAPCYECTEPALLSDVRGFVDTGLWYSAGGHAVSEHGDVLRVGLRPWIDDAEAVRIAEGAGGVARGAPVDAEGLRWLEVEPGARSSLDVAMALANEAGVQSVGW
jgi:hypothetical protein